MDHTDTRTSRHGLGWQYYWNPWWREKRIYFTDQSVEDCRRLLNESTSRFLGRRVRRTLYTPADFTLYRNAFYNNGFRPYAYVIMREGLGRGTLVTVTVSTATFTRWFLVFWFGFIAVWTALALGSGLREGRLELAGLAIGAAFAVFMLLLNAFGRLVARGDQSFLEDFLREEIGLSDPPAEMMPVA
jgi:hypothetical protein